MSLRPPSGLLQKLLMTAGTFFFLRVFGVLVGLGAVIICGLLVLASSSKIDFVIVHSCKVPKLC